MENTNLVPNKFNKNDILLYALDLPAFTQDRNEFIERFDGNFIQICFGNKSGKNPKVMDSVGNNALVISNNEIEYKGNFYSSINLDVKSDGKKGQIILTGDGKDSVLKYFGTQKNEKSNSILEHLGIEKDKENYQIIISDENNLNILNEFLSPNKDQISTDSINALSDIINHNIVEMINKPTKTAKSKHPTEEKNGISFDDEFSNF